ncbi:MAG: DinB family protein [Pirellula sp.]
MNAVSTNTIATIAYAKQIVADIEDAKMAEQPLGMNHPAWLLLHLSTAADYAASLLGGKGVCPPDWNDKADTKKPLTQDRKAYPSKEELVSTFEAAFRNAADLFEKSSAESLSKPQQLGFFEKELPTVADMATFLIVAHTNLHLGQLSAWRRAMGKAPLF